MRPAVPTAIFCRLLDRGMGALACVDRFLFATMRTARWLQGQAEHEPRVLIHHAIASFKKREV